MNPAALVSLFVRHRNAANLLMILMILAGVVGVFRLNTQLFPDFGIDIVSVSIEWPGASADDVEANIVASIEPEVRFLDDVRKVTSYAAEGVGTIVVEFNPGADMQAALSDVESAVTQVTTLPEESETPNVSRVVRYDGISRIVISGPYSEASLKAIAKRMRDDLLGRGIDKITLFGTRDEEIWVEIPPDTLRRLDLTLNDIADRIAQTSLDLPSGTLEGAQEKQIRSIGLQTDAAGLADTEVKSLPGGQKIRLRDIARLTDSFDKKGKLGLRLGVRAIELFVQRSTSTDALRAASVVEGYLADVLPTLPPDLRLDQYDVQAGLISDRINLLLRNGLGGLLLVMFVLFVFLNGRVAFWVAVGIPVAMMANLGVMLISGQSINMVSLFAMIMTLGIIVDDAIVVGEHAAARRSAGMPALQAAETGALRMLPPVVASSLTTIAAFLPLLVISDIIGQIISAIPYVVVSVLIASLIECFLILPGHLRGAMASQGEKDGRFRRWFDAGFGRLRDGAFRRLVAWCVRWRYLTVAASISMLVLSVGLVAGGRIDFVFFNSPEAETVNANVLFAPGTPRERTAEMLAELERALTEVNAEHGEDGEVVTMSFAKVGVSQAERFQRLNGDHYGGMQVELTPSDYRDLRTADFINTWRDKIELLPGIERIALRERAGGPPGRELDIRLTGRDTGLLKQAALDVRELLSRFDGVSDIEDDLPYGKQEIILELTPRGKALGFTTETVARQVRHAFEGALAKRFAREDEEVTVRVMYPAEQSAGADLRSLYLRAPQGAEVPLSDVVSLRETAGFERIRREDGVKEVAVTAEIDEAVTNANEVITALQQGDLPAIMERYGLKVRFAGKAEEQAKTLADMRVGAMIGLAAIYIILAWVFASYSRPIVVMAIIPFGLIGAILGHLAMDYSLTILSMVALLGLSGILVNDSIILVSTIDERIEKREGVFEAIVNGTCDRFRAVLLTSLTTVLGLTPLLFETSLQARFLIPMAVTIVFGLMAASVLVLIVVPALIAVQEDVKRGFAVLYRSTAEPADIAGRPER